MLQGVSRTARKRHNKAAPNFLQGLYDVRSNAMQGTPRLLQGVKEGPQKCRFHVTPTSFIWCRDIIAAMPIQKRTKGRADCVSQKCHGEIALPTQFNGVIVKTQKCQDIVAPRERSFFYRSNAIVKTPLPTSLTGAITTSQKCYKVNAPREGSTMSSRNAI